VQHPYTSASCVLATLLFPSIKVLPLTKGVEISELVGGEGEITSEASIDATSDSIDSKFLRDSFILEDDMDQYIGI